MKNRRFLTAVLSTAILMLASCEKDGGGSSSSGMGTSSDNISLPNFATLYSYIGRTDIENIAQQFRNEGYTVETHYPEVEEGDRHGCVYAEKYNNTGNGSAYGYNIYFDQNGVSQCRFRLYKPKARAEFSNIFNNGVQFCRNWTQTRFWAAIGLLGGSRNEYSTAEDFHDALVAIDSPTNYISCSSTYDNGLVFHIQCTEDVDLYYEIENNRL